MDDRLRTPKLIAAVVLPPVVVQVRERLHIVLAFSPIGAAFRTRCRMFPSLVNCCTIDWFNAWPEDALYSVAESFLTKTAGELGAFAPNVIPLCATAPPMMLLPVYLPAA